MQYLRMQIAIFGFHLLPFLQADVREQSFDFERYVLSKGTHSTSFYQAESFAICLLLFPVKNVFLTGFT
jgi:hypothetical protein